MLSQLSIPYWSDFNLYEDLQKTFPHIWLSIPYWPDFNHANEKPSWLAGINFQSLIGLISTDLPTPSSLDLDTFQSHFGLISTCFIQLSSINTINSFNPILVWFQPAVTDANTKTDDRDSFQSHFGLISTNKNDYKKHGGKRTFNPILVWFQLSTREFRVWRWFFFQSHFGLISTSSAFHLFFASNLYFQSHFGLISTDQPKHVVLVGCGAFNPILVWFQPIYSITSLHFLYDLSIPFWSDFNS